MCARRDVRRNPDLHFPAIGGVVWILRYLIIGVRLVVAYSNAARLGIDRTPLERHAKTVSADGRIHVRDGKHRIPAITIVAPAVLRRTAMNQHGRDGETDLSYKEQSRKSDFIGA